MRRVLFYFMCEFFSSTPNILLPITVQVGKDDVSMAQQRSEQAEAFAEI